MPPTSRGLRRFTPFFQTDYCVLYEQLAASSLPGSRQKAGRRRIGKGVQASIGDRARAQKTAAEASLPSLNPSSPKTNRRKTRVRGGRETRRRNSDRHYYSVIYSSSLQGASTRTHTYAQPFGLKGGPRLGCCICRRACYSTPISLLVQVMFERPNGYS